MQFQLGKDFNFSRESFTIRHLRYCYINVYIMLLQQTTSQQHKSLKEILTMTPDFVVKVFCGLLDQCLYGILDSILKMVSIYCTTGQFGCWTKWGRYFKPIYKIQTSIRKMHNVLFKKYHVIN